jgi:hypothetical protein
MLQNIIKKHVKKLLNEGYEEDVLIEYISNLIKGSLFENKVYIAGGFVREYPLGTKFKALMGGHWIRVERGFKWCTGSTFPNVGGDWTGEVCLPNIT